MRDDEGNSKQPLLEQPAHPLKHPRVSLPAGTADSTSSPQTPSNAAQASSQHSSAHTPLPPATSSADEPVSGVTIAIDPGHNGGNATHPEEIARLVPAGANGTTKACNTTGTETNDGSLTEAQFNWDVAMDLVPRLEALGASLIFTRHSNAGVGPCVNQRAEIANRAHAAVDVAIHADGNEAAGAHGFDVIHASTEEMVTPAMAAPSLKLAVDIRNALIQAGVPPANYVGDDGLDTRSDLAGLNLARVPAVLVELGNMRSASEAAKLEAPSYRRKLAGAIAVGILSFLRR
jgi:N-acetylmuramoyl-L-alanine amidase